MEKDVLREKLAEARTRRLTAQIGCGIGALLFIVLIYLMQTRSGYYPPGRYPPELGFIIGGFIGMVILAVAYTHYDGLVKKYMKQLEKSPKRKKEEALKEDPLKLLKLRLAKGEITKKEFREMKKALEE